MPWHTMPYVVHGAFLSLTCLYLGSISFPLPSLAKRTSFPFVIDLCSTPKRCLVYRAVHSFTGWMNEKRPGCVFLSKAPSSLSLQKPNYTTQFLHLRELSEPSSSPQRPNMNFQPPWDVISNHLDVLSPSYSEYVLWIGSLSITPKFIIISDSQPWPPDLLNQHLHFNKTLGWHACPLKCEKPRSGSIGLNLDAF